ncbi:MAG: hypothetical protein P4M09_23215 [Devosia sp.]|nr:hypothetical protein [Devosia sp.]
MNRILTATALVAMAALTAAPALAASTTTTTTTMTKTMTAKPAPKMAAATPAKPKFVTFKTIDANHDGKISMVELKKYFPKLTKADFAKYDANKDGFYDHAELAAFVKAQQPAKTKM